MNLSTHSPQPDSGPACYCSPVARRCAPSLGHDFPHDSIVTRLPRLAMRSPGSTGHPHRSMCRLCDHVKTAPDQAIVVSPSKCQNLQVSSHSIACTDCHFFALLPRTASLGLELRAAEAFTRNLFLRSHAAGTDLEERPSANLAVSRGPIWVWRWHEEQPHGGYRKRCGREWRQENRTSWWSASTTNRSHHERTLRHELFRTVSLRTQRYNASRRRRYCTPCRHLNSRVHSSRLVYDKTGDNCREKVVTLVALQLLDPTQCRSKSGRGNLL
nr:hypothetical protein CFP56_30870 [Quercus suber]